jgi:hypothetical protein
MTGTRIRNTEDIISGITKFLDNIDIKILKVLGESVDSGFRNSDAHRTGAPGRRQRKPPE